MMLYLSLAALSSLDCLPEHFVLLGGGAFQYQQQIAQKFIDADFHQTDHITLPRFFVARDGGSEEGQC